GLRREAGTPVVHVAAGVVRKQTKLAVGAGGALQAGGSASIAGDGRRRSLSAHTNFFGGAAIVRPVGGVQPEALGIFVRRHLLPRQAAQPVFLKGDFPERRRVLEERRKRSLVIFQAPALSGSPGIFQVDANELAEPRAIKSLFGRGQE